MIALYLFIGACAGFLSGLLGIGGGIIVVPSLAATFAYTSMTPNEVMHMAVGTSMAALVATTASSLRAYAKHGSVNWIIVKKLLPGLLVGAMAGVIIAYHLTAVYIKIIFSLFLIFVATRILFAKYAEGPQSTPSQLSLLSISGFIGVLSSIIGVGGGAFIIPFLLRCRFTLLQATGTAVACAMSLGIVATVSFLLVGFFKAIPQPWSTGYIYWPALVGIVVTSVLFAPLGVKLAHKLPTPILKRFFACFLYIVAAKMIIIG